MTEQQAQQRPAQGQALDADERGELIRLREEIAALRETRRRRVRVSWRPVTAALLIIIGCVLGPVTVVSIWAHNQISNTDRFVATVGPLAQDPAVRTLVTDRVTATVINAIDVPALTNQAADALQTRGVPPRVVDRVRGLAGPIQSGVNGFVHDKVAEFVASATFADLFNRAITAAHQQLNAALSGQSSAVTISGGKVVLDLGPFIDRVKQRLVTSGFTPANAIPSVHPTVAIGDASALVKARNGYNFLDSAATWLPWITIVILAAGVYIARDHRKALRNTGFGIAAAMLVLAIGLAIARSAVINGVAEQSVDAAGSAYDIVVNFLRAGLRSIFVLGIVVGLGAGVMGPSVTAVRIRHGAAAGVRWLREHVPAGGRDGGPVGAWVHNYRVPLRIAVLAIGVLVFIFLDRPSGLTIILIAVVMLVCLGVIQFLDRPARAPAESA